MPLVCFGSRSRMLVQAWEANLLTLEGKSHFAQLPGAVSHSRGGVGRAKPSLAKALELPETQSLLPASVVPSGTASPPQWDGNGPRGRFPGAAQDRCLKLLEKNTSDHHPLPLPRLPLRLLPLCANLTSTWAPLGCPLTNRDTFPQGQCFSYCSSYSEA